MKRSGLVCSLVSRGFAGVLPGCYIQSAGADKAQHLLSTAADRACLQIAEASALDDATRQLAAELLITLCEAREKAPGMMRKLPQFIGRFFQILLAFLLDIEVRQ